MNNYNIWALKTISDKERLYKYDDILTSQYSYDSNVANSRQILEGDYVILIDKKHILGFAKIDRITEKPSIKEISRCPECDTTTFDTRKTKHPKHRCRNKHEFSEPVIIKQNVTTFSAFYKESFIRSVDNIPITILRPYYHKGYNGNMSMQNISPQFFKNNVNNTFEKLKNGKYYISPNEAEHIIDTKVDYSPNNEDSRVLINSSIRARRGQQKFRDTLLQRFDERCAITNCSIKHLLEAAHIKPYRGEHDNSPSNGIILRTDIHTLFDLGLVGIEPKTGRVHVDVSIYERWI